MALAVLLEGIHAFTPDRQRAAISTLKSTPETRLTILIT
jgi:hypothetical protein